MKFPAPHKLLLCGAIASVAWLPSATTQADRPGFAGRDPQCRGRHFAQAKNVILFVGDGMGVSTVTATRIYSVGVDGELVMDQFPYTSLSRTSTTDHITPDSAGTMTAMMSGENTNSGTIGLNAESERQDFNQDGDTPVTSLLELAKGCGMKAGVVSTARITHATPAATYAHVNDRDFENEIAAQALPTDPTYNAKLGDGVDLLWGGGRRYFVPSGASDEEGEGGSRSDGRDLRAEFQAAGYSYVWNQAGFDALTAADLPSLGLFDRSHMEYEYDRAGDLGGEPSLSEMTASAVELLEKASRRKGYFLMVESGRIDHGHHATNAFRAITDAEEFDKAIGAALMRVDLRDTLILVTADHSHVFTMAGYPMRPLADLPYAPTAAPADYVSAPHNNLFDVVYDLNASTGEVYKASDSNGVPYTILGYQNGVSYRGTSRVDPYTDPFPGLDGNSPNGPNDPEYMQETAVPIGSETHSAEEVALYAIGAGAWRVRGTHQNTFVFDVMKAASGL